MTHLAHADTSGERKSRKVIYLWDKAGIDLGQWSRWKQGSGVYFVSLRKENMVAKLAAVNDFERDRTINSGVVSDCQMRTAGRFIVGEVSYRCPATGGDFSFITTVTGLQPGVIAHLYKMRWDIEKVFDVVKNRLDETRA